VIGFLDDNPDALAGHPVDVPVLGPLRAIQTGTAHVIALGEPTMRGPAALATIQHGGHLVSLVHPGATVAPTARLGPGVVVCPYAFVSVEARLGSNVVINVHACVGHDSTIGDNCVVSPYAIVTGAATLAADCFMGTHSTLSPGVRVGRRSKIAAGAVVTRDADPGSLLPGCPAKGRVMFAADPADE
jgi:sugar O-acyltransferase (sialic acid O-acetyltransferase NeuD family)